MVIGTGKYRYSWIDDWVKIPDSSSCRENGRTHGIVIARDRSVIIFNQSVSSVLTYNKEGKLIGSWGEQFKGAHGLTLVECNGKEFLWLTDENSGEVVKASLSGKIVQSIKKPDIKIYNNGSYSPTWVAEFEDSKRGNGDIWLADGYGSSLVHRYDKNGNYLQILTGEEGAGRFNCPHSLFIDYRKNNPELYIADRGNKRFQVYDLDGKFNRTFGEDIFGCPCGGIEKDGTLYIPELCARLALLDEKDKLICYLGQNEETCNLETWPNNPEKLIQQGKFNSPHHLAVDDSNNIYVVEWIIGGRITKLEKI